ncbi:MAG TPA: endonuclease/exonuclease/phosphatase family protein [Vulgatibacter sp.]|nr:endonuclease/exonuclease/phosphatase family protein [Vulgatibacter sp.]
MALAAETNGPTELTVATYNIHGGIGVDGRFDLGRIASVLQEVDADVVALQEVGDVRGKGPAINQATALGEILGCVMIYQPTILRGDRAYGNAIATRLTVEGSRSYDLSVRKREPRGCVRADIRLGPHPLHVFAVHLGLSRAEQKAQAGMLLGADIVRDAAVAWPLVVMGDFNFWFPGPIARMVRRSLMDVAVLGGRRERTFPSRLPFLRLDRIYVDDAWEVSAVHVHRTPLARVASDHLPLVARLRLRAEAIALPARAERGVLATP